jgi:hypothetical protein
MVRWFGSRPTNPASEADKIDVLLLARRDEGVKIAANNHGVVELLFQLGMLKHKGKQTVRATKAGRAYLERFEWAR